MNIRNMYLQALVEANSTEKKRHEKEARDAVKIERELAKEQIDDEENGEVAEPEETTEPAQDPDTEAPEETSETEETPDEEPTDNPAPEDVAGTDQDPLGAAGQEFDMDVSDDDLADETPADGEGEEGQDPMAQVPAPDGLPEADDDGSADDDSPTPDEQNIQVNILQLSKLDRQLAKKYIYRNFMGLRSSINSLLETIDRNEVIIVPDVREPAITELNRITVDVDRFMKYRFPTINYEKALQCYFIFAKQINAVADSIRNDGFGPKAHQHKNKGD